MDITKTTQPWMYLPFKAYKCSYSEILHILALGFRMLINHQPHINIYTSYITIMLLPRTSHKSLHNSAKPAKLHAQKTGFPKILCPEIKTFVSPPLRPP